MEHVRAQAQTLQSSEDTQFSERCPGEDLDRAEGGVIEPTPDASPAFRWVLQLQARTSRLQGKLYVRGKQCNRLGKVWCLSSATRNRCSRHADVRLQLAAALAMNMLIFFRPTSRLELRRNQNSVTSHPCPLTSLTSQASSGLACTNNLAAYYTTPPFSLPSHSLGLADLAHKYRTS